MGDPAGWDVDRVVQELCTTQGTLGLYADTDTRLPDSLAERLRYHEIRGQHLLDCAENTAKRDLLFGALAIAKYPHQALLLDACCRAKRESEKSRESEKRRESEERRENTRPWEDAETREQAPVVAAPKRIVPQRVAEAPGQPAQDDAVNQEERAWPGLDVPDVYSIVHAHPDDDDTRTFSFVGARPASAVRRRMVHRWDKRARLRGHRRSGPPARRRRARQADQIAAPSNPWDEVLPTYGESADESGDDSDAASGLDMEERETRPPGQEGRSLGAEEINRALEALVAERESEWEAQHLATLRAEASGRWEQLRAAGRLHAQQAAAVRVQHLDERIHALRRKIMGMEGIRDVAEIRRQAAVLRPSIDDRMEARWERDLVRQEQAPQRGPAARAPFARRETHADEEPDDSGEDIEDVVTRYRPGARDQRMPLYGVARGDAPVPAPAGEAAPRDGGGGGDPMVLCDGEDGPAQDDDDNQGGDNQDGDEQDDDDGVARGEEGAALDMGAQFACADVSPQEWQNICRLFQCGTTEVTEHRPVGFRVALSGYQMRAVHWMLTQLPVRQIAGGCLGDEMGLGKTIEVLATWVLFATIRRNAAEVREFWRTGKAIDGRTHLAPAQEGLGHTPTCPSQDRSPYGVLCPCVEAGESYQIATRMVSLPTICFAPAHAIPGWRREFEKLVDRRHELMKDLRLSSPHHSLRGDADAYHDHARVLETRARVHPDRRREPWFYLGGRAGLSNWFLLVSSVGARDFLRAYDEEDEEDEDDAPPRRNRLAAALVFFDEAHAYRGALNKPTQPFALLAQITRQAWSSTVAFAVSGSIPGGGPVQLVATVAHILQVAGERAQADQVARIGRVQDAREVDAMKNDWTYILQKGHMAANPKTRDEIEKRRASLRTSMEDLVPRVLLARRSTDRFRGRPIGEGSRAVPIHYERCDMLDGPGRDAFCQLTAQVQTYIGRAFEESHSAWAAGDRTDEEPSRQSVEAQFFHRPAHAWEAAAEIGRTWIQLARANVYPEIARLFVEGRIATQELAHEAVNTRGRAAGRLVCARAPPQQLRDALAASPLWPYREALAGQSPKFARLCGYVDEMVARRDRQPTPEDPGPGDGTNIRHMVVFTDSPASGYATFLLLCWRYPGIRTLLINALTPQEQGKADAYSRGDILDDLLADCTPASPNKILVSTYRICGTALNLQRANYCVMMEPASDPKEEAQAAARVNRRGQNMRPVLVRLHDERNLQETIKRARHQNQAMLEGWAREGIPWEDFTR